MVARTRKQARSKPAKKNPKHPRVNVGLEGIDPLKFHVMPLKAFIMSVQPMWYHEGRIYKLIDRTVMEGNVEWFRIPDHLDVCEMAMENRGNGWELQGEYVGTKEAIAWIRKMETDYHAAGQAVREAKEKQDAIFDTMEKQMCSDHYAAICGL